MDSKISLQDIQNAIEKLKKQEEIKPRRLIYPESLVEAAGGTDKTIDFIRAQFGIKMKFEGMNSHQCLFKEC